MKLIYQKTKGEDMEPVELRLMDAIAEIEELRKIVEDLKDKVSKQEQVIEMDNSKVERHMCDSIAHNIPYGGVLSSVPSSYGSHF